MLLQCGKSRLAIQMFTNIDNMGPALSLYPASQRVTYLYYLGRFFFDCCHFLRAHSCLEEAYRQCPPRFQKHRRLIVTYWIPSNLLIARFPSQALLQRPEAAHLGEVFLPICSAIRTGNFIAYHQAMAKNFDWLWDKGLYITMLYRLRPLVWRSLTRKTFMLTYTTPTGDGSGNTNARAAPILDLADVATTASYTQKRLEGYIPGKPAPRERPPHVNSIFMRAVTNNASADSASTLVPPPGGPRKLRPSEGLICGNLRVDTVAVEGVVAPLVAAGLLSGFISHSQKKFAISGTKQSGGDPVAAGWPNPYQSIIQRLSEPTDDGEPGPDVWHVPSWVKAP